MFKPVSPKLNVTSMEENVLKFWKQAEIFKKTVEQRKDGPVYVFYEGPPTANGKPGVHHVLARAFKDMFPRYKIMRGYHVSRRGGWDTHGLPVEIGVEKQLGFTNNPVVNVEAALLEQVHAAFLVHAVVALPGVDVVLAQVGRIGQVAAVGEELALAVDGVEHERGNAAAHPGAIVPPGVDVVAVPVAVAVGQGGAALRR